MLTGHFIDSDVKKKKRTFRKQAPNQHIQIPVGFKYG